MFVFTSTEGVIFEILHDITQSNLINNEEKKVKWQPFTLKDATGKI